MPVNRNHYTTLQNLSIKKYKSKFAILRDSISSNQNILRKDIDDDENMVEFLQNILYELKLTTGKLKVNRAINILNRQTHVSISQSRGGDSRSNSRSILNSNVMSMTKSMILERKTPRRGVVDRLNLTLLQSKVMPTPSENQSNYDNIKQIR